MERILRFIEESNTLYNVTKGVDCSIVSKIWNKYKRNRMIKKKNNKANEKQMGRSKSQCLCENSKKLT